MVRGKSVTHAVRNEQREYKSRRRKSVTVWETMCGRHVEGDRVKKRVTCRTCAKALRASRR